MARGLDDRNELRSCGIEALAIAVRGPGHGLFLGSWVTSHVAGPSRPIESQNLLKCLFFFVGTVLLHLALSIWHTSPFGSNLANFVTGAIQFGGSVVSLLALPFGVVGFLVSRPLQSPRIRSVSGYLMIPPVLYLGAFMITRPLEHMLRERQLRAVVARGHQVVLALGDYERVHKKAPNELQDLVPAYLPVAPSTGMPAFPLFRYEREGAFQMDK